MGIKQALVVAQGHIAREQVVVARTGEEQSTGERLATTMAAAGHGQLTHLLISPDVRYSGDKGVEATPYPADTPDNRQFMARLPPTTAAAGPVATNPIKRLAASVPAVHAAAQPLAVLVVAGGQATSVSCSRTVRTTASARSATPSRNGWSSSCSRSPPPASGPTTSCSMRASTRR